MCAFNDFVFRISEQSFDKRRLGRWSSLTIRGENKLKTTFITAYCPVKGSNPGSTYSQQLVYMANHRSIIPSSIICPRQLFGHDLSELLQDLTNKGHQIILMGDFNTHYAKLCDWMKEFGLVDTIARQHGPCPVTYNRSNSKPLDSIFTSPKISPTLSGYLSFGRLAGDLRGVWIDVPKILLYGYNPP